MCKPLTMDRKATSRPFLRARRVERNYAQTLLRLARHIGDIARDLAHDPDKLSLALMRYAEMITPWAEAVGTRMVAEVNSRDLQDWKDLAREVSAGLAREIASTPVGQIVRERVAEQVTLIKSIPLDAAKRVQELSLEAVISGTRSSDMVEEIMRLGDVSKARARTIARTEVGRASANLSRARAEKAGSVSFIWRTVGDSGVRDSHRALNGKTFQWDDPPECDPGYRSLPGAIFNCRCYAEPILP